MTDSKNSRHAFSSGNRVLNWSIFIISPPFYFYFGGDIIIADCQIRSHISLFFDHRTVNITAKYQASCYCNAVQYEVCSDPVDAKICHCLACQKLHGAPMQWAAIFHKHDVRITEGIDHLNFYNNELNKHERILPCKVSCALCGTLIADEGRKMWLAFPSLFNFGGVSKVPTKFKPTCHIFYGMRVIDINDDLPKWFGHKNQSPKFD